MKEDEPEEQKLKHLEIQIQKKSRGRRNEQVQKLGASD